MHLQPLIYSRPASLRCTLSLLAIALPSRELAPADVVHAQLEALQADDLQTCYAFASPANRRNIGPWPNLEVIVKRTPAFSPLAGCASFEVLSALSLGKVGVWDERYFVLTRKGLHFYVPPRVSRAQDQCCRLARTRRRLPL